MANAENLTKSAQRIKTIRLSLGLSMDAFAERIDGNTKQGTVGNWETAKNAPNAKRLKRIADLGHVSVGYLRGDTDDPTPQSPQRYRFKVDPYWAIRQALSIYVANNLPTLNPRQEPALNWFLTSYVDPSPSNALTHLTNANIDAIIDQYLKINHESTFTLDGNPNKHKKLWSLIEISVTFKAALTNIYRTNTLVNSYVIDIPNNTIYPVEYGHHAETIMWLLAKQMPDAKFQPTNVQNSFINSHYQLVGPHRFNNIKED